MELIRLSYKVGFPYFPVVKILFLSFQMIFIMIALLQLFFFRLSIVTLKKSKPNDSVLLTGSQTDLFKSEALRH